MRKNNILLLIFFINLTFNLKIFCVKQKSKKSTIKKTIKNKGKSKSESFKSIKKVPNIDNNYLKDLDKNDSNYFLNEININEKELEKNQSNNDLKLKINILRKKYTEKLLYEELNSINNFTNKDLMQIKSNSNLLKNFNKNFDLAKNIKNLKNQKYLYDLNQKNQSLYFTLLIFIELLFDIVTNKNTNIYIEYKFFESEFYKNIIKEIKNHFEKYNKNTHPRTIEFLKKILNIKSKNKSEFLKAYEDCINKIYSDIPGFNKKFVRVIKY